MCLEPEDPLAAPGAVCTTPGHYRQKCDVSEPDWTGHCRDDQARLRSAGKEGERWSGQREVGAALSLGCTAPTEGTMVT